MLNNLQHCYLARLPAAAAWPVRLRLLLPDLPAAVRVELAGVLGRLGRFSEAAAVIDAVAGEVDDARGEQLRRTAARFRACATDRASPAGSVQVWQVARFRCSRSKACCSRTA